MSCARSGSRPGSNSSAHEGSRYRGTRPHQRGYREAPARARSRGLGVQSRQEAERAPPSVERLTGDRADGAAFKALADRGFDAVIDMIGFSPRARGSDDPRPSRVAPSRVLFCSTCCVYGVDIPPDVVIDETYTPRPTSNYGKDKLRQEQLYQEAASKGAFQAAIVRPSCTYGPRSFSSISSSSTRPPGGASNVASRCCAAQDGLGLWQATHRDDVGKLFAYSVLNPKTYGRAYNATRDEVFTWRDFYRQGAEALGKARCFRSRARWISRSRSRTFRTHPRDHRLSRRVRLFQGEARRAEFRCEVGFVQERARPSRTSSVAVCFVPKPIRCTSEWSRRRSRSVSNPRSSEVISSRGSEASHRRSDRRTRPHRSR